MKKIILYTKYDLRDFGFIKFDKIYGFENDDIKGSLMNFPTKEDAEKYFSWHNIKLEIKDEFWKEMKSKLIICNYSSGLCMSNDSEFNIWGKLDLSKPNIYVDYKYKGGIE